MDDIRDDGGDRAVGDIRLPGAGAPRRYRLDARHFSGPLHAPARNDREQHESDDLTALVELARGLVEDGFTVWIYERFRRSVPWPESWDLRLVTQLGPGRAPG